MILILREGLNCTHLKFYQRLVQAFYEVLYVCVTHCSQDDCLYMASYLDFFLSQVSLKVRYIVRKTNLFMKIDTILVTLFI